MSDRNTMQSIARLVPEGSRVLDLGCGDGALLDLLRRERGCSGYGVEIADDNVLGCVKRGVDVTLFATADSVTTARLVGTAPTGYSEDAALHAKAWEALHISAVFEQAGEFDLIHN
ncbi:MAG: methionine biosynthesis protein MetW, partial [Ramlibacter sp.]